MELRDIREFVANATGVTTFRTALTQFQGRTHDGDRNLYKIFGYKDELETRDFYAMYRRFGIANRAIRAFPQATWSEAPLIYDEAGQSPEDSKFVKDVNDFMKKHKVYRHFERVDRLSGIGQYGVLLLGFAGDPDFSQPLMGKKPLVYMKPYMDTEAVISEWVTDKSNPRYGLPLMYRITPDHRQVSTFSRTGSSTQKQIHKEKFFEVHYSRVMHISEFLDDDDVFGSSRLQPVFNHLVDLQKVAGGAGELFWLNGRGGLGLFADKEANLDAAAKTAIKDQAKEYQHELRRIMTGVGMKAQPISFNVPDPQPTANVLLDLVAGGLGIPKRILLGSERGELSSNQDENNFNERTKERQVNFAAPDIVQVFVDKMIETGNFPQPQGQVTVEWSSDVNLNPQAQADVNLKKTQSLVAYSNSPNAEIIMPQTEFRETMLGLPATSEFEDTAIEDLDETEEEQEVFEEMTEDE